MFCQKCGANISDQAVMCPSCGAIIQTLKPKSTIKTAEAGDAVVDIVTSAVLPNLNCSKYAVLSEYIGLFSLVIFLAPLLSPLAFLFGILAIRDIMKHSGKTGIVRVSIGVSLGVIGIVGFLLLIRAMSM